MINKHSSGFIIQWDRQLPLCLWDAGRGLLGTEERVEKDKPGKETTQQQLMALSSYKHRDLDIAQLHAGLTWPHP